MLSVGNRTQWGQGGNVKEGLKLTPMSSFDIEQGALTLDLIVVEFWSGCGQMDLASACVLCPSSCLVLDFIVWVRGQVNEQRSGEVTGDIGEG